MTNTQSARPTTADIAAHYLERAAQCERNAELQANPPVIRVLRKLAADYRRDAERVLARQVA